MQSWIVFQVLSGIAQESAPWLVFLTQAVNNLNKYRTNTTGFA
jgi:hypothetical protein